MKVSYLFYSHSINRRYEYDTWCSFFATFRPNSVIIYPSYTQNEILNEMRDKPPWLMHFLFYLTINPQFKKRVFSNNSSPIKHLKLCVNYHLNAYIFYPDNFHVKLFGIVFFKISSLVFQNPTIFLHSPSTEHFNWFNTLFKKGNIKSQIKMIKI